MSSRRPNVLLVMADQLSAGWLEAYGHPVVQAPATAQLAEESVVFESAYCASPLCSPSRASMLTGRLPSDVEVFDNAAELRASTPTLAHHLRAAGYSTTLVGKMHFVGPDQLHGFERRLTTDIYPADLAWTPDWRRPVSDPLPWYHTTESIRTPGRCEASMQMDYDQEVAFRAVRHIFDEARRDDGTPFFLVASFTHPHDPWELRPRYWDRYDPAAIDLPAVPGPPPGADDPHSRRLREMCGLEDEPLSEEEIRAARHGYFAAISYVDERIGELLHALREAGLEDDTIVLFTSDHGEMLGERGLWYKMAFYEPSARVPLMVRAPGRLSPARLDEPVSLLDVVPTLLELAGVPAGDVGRRLDGESLVALMDGEAGARSGPVVAEYLAEGVVAPAVMIRRGAHKFVSCPGDPDQLFDLERDPLELEDLAGSPQHADVVDGFRREVAERWQLDALRERVLDSQDSRRAVLRALAGGEPVAWDHEPRFDAARQYVRTRDDMYDLQRRARLDTLEPERGRSR